jgi:hypothetical protein
MIVGYFRILVGLALSAIILLGVAFAFLANPLALLPNPFEENNSVRVGADSWVSVLEFSEPFSLTPIPMVTSSPAIILANGVPTWAIVF